MFYQSGQFQAPLSSDEPEFASYYPELSQCSRRALVLEQLYIERKVCQQEITELRELLRKNNIDDTGVESWEERSDKVLDTLVQQGEGEVGRCNQDGSLLTPWSWRRRCRNHYS